MLQTLDQEKKKIKSLGDQIENLNSVINCKSEENELLRQDLAEIKLSLRSLEKTHAQKVTQLNDTEEQLKRHMESHSTEKMRFSCNINELADRIESIDVERVNMEKLLNDRLNAANAETTRLEGIMVCTVYL